MIVASNGGVVRITVDRNGRVIALPPTHTKKIDGVYRLGFAFGVAPVSHSVFSRTADGDLADVDADHGDDRRAGQRGHPPGAGAAAQRGRDHPLLGRRGRLTAISSYLSILAFISLSLAIFNLLPFLPLDGGHVLMIALEKIRGRAVSQAIFGRISAVGHRA